jgi:hypothetical protein
MAVPEWVQPPDAVLIGGGITGEWLELHKKLEEIPWARLK